MGILPEPEADNPSRKTRVEKLGQVLALLSDLSMTPTEFLTLLLSSDEPQFRPYQTQLYAQRSDRLDELLDVIWESPGGRVRLEAWMMAGPAEEVVCAGIRSKMESSKLAMLKDSDKVTIEDLAEFSINDMMEEMSLPDSWTAVFDAATTGPTSEKNAKKSPTLVCVIYFLLVLHVRSQNAQRLQLSLGLYAWGTGASRALIEVMNRCQLLCSYTTILLLMKSIGDQSVQAAKNLVNSQPHLYAYDNYNASHSIHVEQRPGGPSKVQSSTFPVIYELHNAKFEDMLLQPMLDNLSVATELTVGDISSSEEQLESYAFQAKIHVVRALVTHVKSFSDLENDPILQHRARRQLSPDHRTQYHPLRIAPIEEASTKGNLQVHDDTYGDINAWERRQLFQLGMGLFHLIMNLIWGINKKYAGSVRETGTLRYYFSLMDKVRLSGDKPDYHALLATLEQILDGLLLHAWILECGHASFDAFANSKPTSQQLLHIAERILLNHASPSSSTLSNSASSIHDTAHRNICLLTRELLYVVEFVCAVRDGDFGRIEDIYPEIARIFRGAGSFNYSNEILHFIHNVKRVWTPEFAFVSTFPANAVDYS
ncbi:hypothetical protein C8J56DRAFT_867146 [Mycena floridula]|nr:hypothetical protein C8J56DRAFT_867146 [Mycena floridula]